MNKVMLLGRITRDIELRHTPSNTAVCTVGLAMNRKWKTPEGEQREEVCFVDCEAFGRTAEVIAQYFAKGKLILLDGRLKLDEWEDKESGQKRSKLKVIIESFYFVDSKKEGEASAPAAKSAPAAGNKWGPRASPKPQMSTPTGRALAGQPEPDDDIAF